MENIIYTKGKQFSFFYLKFEFQTQDLRLAGNWAQNPLKNLLPHPPSAFFHFPEEFVFCSILGFFFLTFDWYGKEDEVNISVYTKTKVFLYPFSRFYVYIILVLTLLVGF